MSVNWEGGGASLFLLGLLWFGGFIYFGNTVAAIGALVASSVGLLIIGLVISDDEETEPPNADDLE